MPNSQSKSSVTVIIPAFREEENIEAAIENAVLAVSSVITDHIIKGNELKLLTPPEVEDDDEKDLADELRDETATIRERYKQLSQQDKQLLIDKYSIKDEEDGLSEV